MPPPPFWYLLPSPLCPALLPIPILPLTLSTYRKRRPTHCLCCPGCSCPKSARAVERLSREPGSGRDTGAVGRFTLPCACYQDWRNTEEGRRTCLLLPLPLSLPESAQPGWSRAGEALQQPPTPAQPGTAAVPGRGEAGEVRSYSAWRGREGRLKSRDSYLLHLLTLKTQATAPVKWSEKGVQPYPPHSGSTLILQKTDMHA